MKYVFLVGLLCPLYLFAQNVQPKLKDIVLKVDTAEYSYSKNNIEYRGYKYFYFEATNQSEVVELTFIPQNIDNIKGINLQSSLDFFIIDSVARISDDFFRAKVQFNDLLQAKFPRFVFQITDANDKVTTEEIKLYPFFKTRYELSYDVDELFEGEDKVINIPTVNGTNIKFDEGWNTSKNIEYKISTSENNIQVSVHPLQAGSEELRLKFKTIRPYLNEYNNLTYDLPPIALRFSVRPSRINYLNIDQSEFFYDPQFKSNIQVQLDLNRNIGLRKTYRIESQQEPGGRLIAELFTQSQVGNSNKILAWLRPYSLHRISDGYLYIKDDDVTRFITNFDIIEKPDIEKISLLREGEDWNSNLAVYPGEKIEVKVEGTGLLKAQIQFDAVANSKIDTTRRSDNVIFYFIKIPVDFPKRKISVFMNNNITRYEMLIREYQTPKDLDFISISYEKEMISIANEKFNKPVLYRDPIEDVVISFDSKKIDNSNKVYGKQFLSVEIKLFNNAKDLIEIQRIDNIVICPGENSPRYAFYDLKDCRKGNINLNDYLLHKTYDMEGWSNLEITIRHNESKYG
ncbi:MAG TPA: hypothetical protein VF691_10140, partial [Cytophagaceae bacterium]